MLCAWHCSSPPEPSGTNRSRLNPELGEYSDGAIHPSRWLLVSVTWDSARLGPAPTALLVAMLLPLYSKISNLRGSQQCVLVGFSVFW